MSESNITGIAANGLLSLAAINTVILLFFALSFAKPQNRRDWRSLGIFPAFIVALFTEMYGFPLTIYLISGWLESRYSALDPFSFSAGQLWHTLFGLSGASLRYSNHLLGYVLVAGGFILIAYAWRVLYEAQRIMFPVLMIIYVRLARSEEQYALDEFGDEYRRYMAITPAFFPRFYRVIRELERKP